MSSSGKILVKLDGKEIGFGGNDGIISLKIPNREIIRNYASNAIILNEGGYTLQVQFKGSETAGRNIIGLDFLWIQKK